MAKSKTVYLLASGDLRLSANLECAAAQLAMEKAVAAAFGKLGVRVKRAHPVARNGHPFIDSQKYGMEVFRGIPAEAPVVVAEAVWQYSYHVLPGLMTHKGPILTVANWSGQWPGLVGMLNLNGSLTKAGVKYATLWSDDFSDEKFLKGLKGWLEKGAAGVKQDLSHVRPLGVGPGIQSLGLPVGALKLGAKFAQKFRAQKAILGIFDEGCMGMFNAIIPDELLNPTGVYKERLSQSALYARMQTVTDAEARKVYEWYKAKGVKFAFGPDEETDLTERQVLGQCKMYIAAMRIADEFGCATIGIQYQQGLKDLVPASDLAEGTLNNVERPPVYSEDGRELYKREALPHYNEVDECTGLDGLVTYRLWRELGYAPETTLHDIRWGRHYCGESKYPEGSVLAPNAKRQTQNAKQVDDYVWVFEISGAVPPEHLVGGWSGVTSERQPGMYFRLGGGTIKGVCKRGHIVWSRVYVEGREGAQKLVFDTGLGEVVELPKAETEERWKLTTSQWPIMHAVLPGVTRDQMMGKHQSNHISVAYAPTRKDAIRALAAKAAAMRELGMEVNICGKV